MMDEWKIREPKFEQVPTWVASVSRLTEVLAIPLWDNDRSAFVPLESFDDERASAEFAEKNILIWELHIHFI